MKQEIIKAITDFIFAEDIPQKSDIILMPGGSHPELGEKAAKLWRGGQQFTREWIGGLNKKL